MNLDQECVVCASTHLWLIVDLKSEVQDMQSTGRYRSIVHLWGSI